MKPSRTHSPLAQQQPCLATAKTNRQRAALRSIYRGTCPFTTSFVPRTISKLGLERTLYVQQQGALADNCIKIPRYDQIKLQHSFTYKRLIYTANCIIKCAVMSTIPQIYHHNNINFIFFKSSQRSSLHHHKTKID